MRCLCPSEQHSRSPSPKYKRESEGERPHISRFRAAYQKLRFLCIVSALTRELPGNVPYIVKLMLIKEFQSNWQEIVLDAGEQVVKILRTYMVSLIDAEFGSCDKLSLHVSYVLHVVLGRKR